MDSLYDSGSDDSLSKKKEEKVSMIGKAVQNYSNKLELAVQFAGSSRDTGLASIKKTRLSTKQHGYVQSSAAMESNSPPMSSTGSRSIGERAAGRKVFTLHCANPFVGNCT